MDTGETDSVIQEPKVVFTPVINSSFEDQSVGEDSLIVVKKESRPDSTADFEYTDFVHADGDGGFGWVIVIAAFSVQFFVLGTMNNFGILFTTLLNEFGKTKQETSWVGSITYGVMFLTGPIATTLCERIGCRPVAILGGVIGALGTLSASFSNTMFKMYLTEGFLLGVGASLCYFPSVIILPQYFSKRLSLANGLVSCGSGVGTMAIGPIINILIDTYGWRTSVRVSSGLMLLVSFISFLYKPFVPPIRGREITIKKPLFDVTIFHNKAFLAFNFALFLFMLAYFVPFVHLTQMAVEYGIPMKKASLLIGFMSVSSTFGRLFFGRIADSRRINRLYVYQLSLLGIGVANTLCPFMKSFSGLVVYCATFGFFEGCYVCLVTVLTGDIVGREKMALGVGTLFGMKSIPLTLGPPLAGFLYDVSNSYQVAFYVAGAIPIVSACIMFSIPFLMPSTEYFHRKNKSSQYCIKRLLVEYSSDDSKGSKNTEFTTNTEPSCNEDDDQVLPSSSNITSFISANRLFFEKKVSMRDIGSVSSLGSILLTPHAT